LRQFCHDRAFADVYNQQALGSDWILLHLPEVEALVLRASLLIDAAEDKYRTFRVNELHDVVEYLAREVLAQHAFAAVVADPLVQVGAGLRRVHALALHEFHAKLASVLVRLLVVAGLLLIVGPVEASAPSATVRPSS